MRRLALLAVLLGALLALTGCLTVPTSGPVSATGEAPVTDADGGFTIVPRGPAPGEPPAAIVDGFLDALQATPLSTTVARQYLDQDLASSWDPGQRTITYADKEPPRGLRSIQVPLVGADWVDHRGTWRGPVAASDADLHFKLARIDGEWRITKAPDALIVPQSWFEARFRQVSLYFFDPTGRILVPEPVFVPRGSQLATALVRDLTMGVGLAGRDVLRTFLPPGGTEGLSVPVGANGEADVQITGGVGQQSPHALQLMGAQLAWTLRQDPTVRSIRLTLNGPSGPYPTDGVQFTVDSGAQFDPTGYADNNLLFGLRDGVVESRAGPRFAPVAGPWGDPHDVSSLAVNLTAKRAAAVTTDGRGVLVGQLGTDGALAMAPLSGSHLLRPAWDFADRLWLVDDTRSGAEVRYLPPAPDGAAVASRAITVHVPGVTGEDVGSFLVSRDGSRLVAVVHGATGDSVVVSRLRSNDDGRVLGATPARVISDPGQGTVRIGMLAWKSPTAVVAVQQLSDTALMRVLSVDGSGSASATLTVGDRVSAIVGSPVGADTLYAVTRGTLLDLTGLGANVSIGRDLTSIGYVG